MVDAATQFRKSGYSDEDAANLALVATMYQNVADEEISAGESANFIISQMKAFGIEADNAMHIIDAVNSVSNNYAVSSSDLANNLGKVSSALAVGGVSFEETLGMMTAITEITRNSSTAARGLVSVQSRYNQIIDETSSTGKKLTAFYDKHGIALKDQDGQLRNLYDVLYDTAGIWNTLDENEQKYFLNIQAGANQTRNLAALMENFGVAVSATATALDSAGSAAKENDRVMDSLQGKINLLKAAWEDFSTNTITKEFIGSILDAGTALLNFANTDMGRAVTKAVLFGTTLGAGAGFVGTFAGKIFQLFGEMKKLGSAIGGPTTLLSKFLAVGTKGKWTIIALGIAAITAALVLLVDALNNGTNAFDRHISKAEEAAQKQEEYATKIDQAKDRLEELNKIPYADRTEAQKEEIALLEEEIRYYEELIALMEKEQQKSLKKARRQLNKQGYTTGKVETSLIQIGGMGEDVTPEAFAYSLSVGYGIDEAEALRVLTATYENTSDAVRAYADMLGISRVAADGSQKSIEQLRKDVEGYGISVDYTAVSCAESTRQISQMNFALKHSKVTTQENVNEAQRLIQANQEIADSLRAYRDAGGELTAAEVEWLNAYDALIVGTEKAQMSVTRVNEAVKILTESIGKVPQNLQITEQSLQNLVKSLVSNSELGISSVGDLTDVLARLGAQGYIDFSQIEGGLEGFIQRLLELEGFEFTSKEIDVNADTSDAQAGLEAVEGAISNIPEGMLVNITTASDADNMVNALGRLQEAIDSFESKDLNIRVNVDTQTALNKLDKLKSNVGDITAPTLNIRVNDGPAQNALRKLQEYKFASKPISVMVSDHAARVALWNLQDFAFNPKTIFVGVNDQASLRIYQIAQHLASLQDKTITITTYYQTVGSPPPNATGTDYWKGGPTLINDGAPVNGSAGELVVSNGMGRIYNEGEETIENLPRGAKIYTAAETQRILRDRGLTVSDLDGVAIPAMANGTTNNKYPDYRLDPNYSGVIALSGEGETLKENFDNWLKEKKHFLALDIISEAQYYRDLEIMNERYLKNMADYRDDYWQHEEEIYEWRNQSLEEQIALEEKLEALAKTKTQKVLTYTGGRFQYLQNIEAISKAQREVSRLTGKYADGTTSARGGLSLVGEEGPELRVLKSGDGIVPADATKNLLSLSRFNAKDIINAAKSNIMQYAFNISNLSLPNVQSPEDFVSGLRNLAYQYSFTRT